MDNQNGNDISPNEDEIQRRAAELAEKMIEERVNAAIPRIVAMIILAMKEDLDLAGQDPHGQAPDPAL